MNAKTHLQTVDCALCGDSQTSVLYDLGDVKVVRCQNCGLAYTNPRICEGDIQEIYSATYFTTKQTDGTGTDYIGRKAQDVVHAHELLSQLERWIKPSDLLEIGCATGHFLIAARERGWQARGVEISPFAAQYARETHSLDVITGVLNVNTYQAATFDVVVMLHVLEHVPSPVDHLHLVHQLLRPGGVLALETPDFGSRRAAELGIRWPLLQPYEHLYHFDLPRLSKFLRRTGYEILDHRTTNRPAIMKYVDMTRSRSLRNLIQNNGRRFSGARRLYRWVRGKMGYDDLLVVFGRKK